MFAWRFPMFCRRSTYDSLTAVGGWGFGHVGKLHDERNGGVKEGVKG